MSVSHSAEMVAVTEKVSVSHSAEMVAVTEVGCDAYLLG